MNQENKIVCQWCKQKVSRIYGKHIQFKHKGKSSADYKKDFPGFALTSPVDKQNTSKNSGKHMQIDKYKQMFSEMLKGDKNPNHKSKTTIKERKSRSPFSKQFYKDRNLSEDNRKEFIKTALKDREFETREDYWIKRGYSKKEAKEKVKIRQTTFSLEICVKKYGTEKGLDRWINRQKLWKSKVFNEKTYIGKGVSVLSDNIINIIKTYNINNDKLFYDDSEKFIYDKKYKRAYKYDLTNDNNKKIIEINGTFWHCKPALYKNTYIHKIKKQTAQEIWDYDNRKQELAKKYGYRLLVVWEDDYNNSPDKVIKKCVDFIYEKNS